MHGRGDRGQALTGDLPREVQNVAHDRGQGDKGEVGSASGRQSEKRAEVVVKQTRAWRRVRSGIVTGSDNGETEKSGGSSKTRIKRVNQLGVKGRSIVFKARSRAERDHWVLAISAEIERMAMQEEVRITKKGKEKGKGKGK